MSVTGEVRKPTIQWIDSQKPVKDSISGFAIKELEAFEATLLAPDLDFPEPRKAVAEVKNLNPGTTSEAIPSSPLKGE
jgi:hypothetical protein